MSTADQQALTDALNAEYAAVYAYGVISAHAAADRNKVIVDFTAAHRARRDATIDALRAAGAPVPSPAPAYPPPFTVDDPIPAAKFAVAVETDTAIAWRSAVEHSESPNVRRDSVEALTDCAVRLATWEKILGTNPATTAFPGRT